VNVEAGVKMNKMAILAAVIVVAIIGAFAGRFFSSEEIQPLKDIQTLTIQGSTTVLPLAQKAAEKYMDVHNVDIQVSGGGSSVGVKSAGEGTVDIGMASREMKDAEKTDYPQLKPIAVAQDGIALIVNPSNSVNSLTIEEIKGIYNGTYTNWSQVGGKDMEIVVIGRDSASGTREFFWKEVMKKGDFLPLMLEKNSNGAVTQTVIQTPGAIGYVGLGYLEGAVKALKIMSNGKEVEPTIQNVQNGSYPISRRLYMLVNGEPTGLIKAFIDFIVSDEGQAIVAQEGFVPL
jgi:phosphate transport system substrate-binding protein